MNYNRKLTENLQKLIHSRKNLLFPNPSKEYSKETRGNDTDSEVPQNKNQTNEDCRINSPGDRDYTDSNPLDKSIESAQNSIETFDTNEQLPSRLSQNSQVGLCIYIGRFQYMIIFCFEIVRSLNDNVPNIDP